MPYNQVVLMCCALVICAAGCNQEAITGDADTSTADTNDTADSISELSPDIPGGCTINRDIVEWMYTECHYIEGSDPARFEILVDDSMGAFVLEITSYYEDGGPASPGTYYFTDADLDECVLCGVVRGGFGSPGMRLQVISGTLEVSELEIVSGSRFQATLTDFVAIQVSITPSGDRYHAEPVEGGEMLCANLMSFDEIVDAY